MKLLIFLMSFLPHSVETPDVISSALEAARNCERHNLSFVFLGIKIVGNLNQFYGMKIAVLTKFKRQKLQQILLSGYFDCVLVSISNCG